MKNAGIITKSSEALTRYSPGMRIIKTSFAVLICVSIHYFLPLIDATNAVIAAIVCLQQNIKTTLQSSYNRALGTIFAGLYAFLFIEISINQAGLKQDSLFFAFLMALFLIPLMQILVVLKKKGAISIAAIVFVIICLSNHHEEPLIFTYKRVIDTFVGIAAAMFTDWLPIFNKTGNEAVPVLNSKSEDGCDLKS